MPAESFVSRDGGIGGKRWKTHLWTLRLWLLLMELIMNLLRPITGWQEFNYTIFKFLPSLDLLASPQVKRPPPERRREGWKWKPFFSLSLSLPPFPHLLFLHRSSESDWENGRFWLSESQKGQKIPPPSSPNAAAADRERERERGVCPSKAA